MKLVKFFAAAIAAVAMFASCEALEGEKTNNNNGNGPVTVELIKIYCDVTATDWDSVGAWAWSIEDTTINYTGGTWPGENLTETEEVDGVQCYVWNCPKDLVGKKIGFILNDYNGVANEAGEIVIEQTEDITIEVVEGMVIKVTEKSESGKWLAEGGDIVLPEEKTLDGFVFGDHAYGVVGGFNNWGEDVMMEFVDGWAVATIEIGYIVDEEGNVTDNVNGEFKVRVDAGWDYSFGYEATEEAPLAPVNGEEFTASFNGQNNNVIVTEAGSYKVEFQIAVVEEQNVGKMKITKLAAENEGTTEETPAE